MEKTLEETKKHECIELFVNRDMQAIPTEWVKIVMDHVGEIDNTPMWGTMFLVDDWIGEKLKAHSRYMVGSKEELKDEIHALHSFDEDEEKKIRKAIKEDDWSVLENYIDEEMSGCYSILDTDGDPTAAFIYEVDGRYLIGINGAGYNFYDGVWDKIYDVIGLEWHKIDLHNCEHYAECKYCGRKLN